MSTLFPVSDSTFRLSVSAFQFRPCLRIALAGRRHHLSLPVFLVLYSDSFKEYSTVAPRFSFPAYHTRLQYHHFCVFCATVKVLSFTAVLRYVLVASVSRSTVRQRALRQPPRSHITASVHPLHLSVLVLYSLAFRPIVPRLPSRSNLADPDIS